MKSRDEVMTILRQARGDLQALFPITRMALFGSYAEAISMKGATSTFSSMLILQSG